MLCLILLFFHLSYRYEKTKLVLFYICENCHDKYQHDAIYPINCLKPENGLDGGYIMKCLLKTYLDRAIVMELSDCKSSIERVTQSKVLFTISSVKYIENATQKSQIPIAASVIYQ